MVRRAWAFVTRPNVLLALVFLRWVYDQTLGPAVDLWRENWLIDHGAAKGPPAGMMDALAAIAAHYVVPALNLAAGPYGVGFLIGGAVFAIPDVLAAWRRWKAKRRLTADDGLLRDLQGFLEVWLRNAIQALATAASFVIHDARLNRPSQLGIVPRLTQDGLHGRLHAAYQKAQLDLSAAVAAGSLNDAQEAVRQCLHAYRGTQNYIGALGSHLGVDLDANEAVADWLETDRECVMRLRELAASPRLKGLRRLAEGIEPASAITAWRDGF